MLQQITKRIWALPCEEKTDRPNLYYIHGDKRSLAIDAGNSPAHVEKFYAALREKGLPLPEVTLITHWHWDHTFGLTAVQGMTIASEKTNEQLRRVQDWIWTPENMKYREQTGEDIPFCNEHILVEYEDLNAIRVIPAQNALEGALTFDLGGVTCRALTADSPHSRDALLIHIPEENALALGDAYCEDYYDNAGKFDPTRLAAFINLIEPIPFEHVLEGHAEPWSKAELMAEMGNVLEDLR